MRYRIKTEDGPHESFLKVAVYDGGEEGSDPIVEYNDTSPPDDSLTHFGFDSSSGASATVRHSCKSTLRQPCGHTLECVSSGSYCGLDGPNAVCECDNEHIWDRAKMECRLSKLNLGEECESSKQCAKLEAKCRTVETAVEEEEEEEDGGKKKAHKRKICKCLDQYYENDEGWCEERAGTVTMPLLLHFISFWRLFRLHPN